MVWSTVLRAREPEFRSKERKFPNFSDAKALFSSSSLYCLSHITSLLLGKKHCSSFQRRIQRDRGPKGGKRKKEKTTAGSTTNEGDS